MPINVNFDAPPTPPSSNDKTNFRLRYDAFLAYIQSLGAKLITFVTQINDLETNVNNKEVSATAASVSAMAAANYKGIFVQGTSNAAIGESWSYNGIIYKCNVATSTNPITDPTKWISLGIDAQTHAATSKSIPVDNDEFPIADSGSSYSLKKLTFGNLKSILWSLFIPAGKVDWFAMTTAPTGYLKANGAAVSRTTYAALFSAIGTTFGTGDGSTTFNLPDLRGQFIRGYDDGRGVDSSRVFGSSQADDLKSHSHTVTVQQSVAGGGGYIRASETSTNGSMDMSLVNATGGAETRPKNVALLACIKY